MMFAVREYLYHFPFLSITHHLQVIIKDCEREIGSVHGDALSPIGFGVEVEVSPLEGYDTLDPCIVCEHNLIELSARDSDYDCRVHQEHLLHPHS